MSAYVPLKIQLHCKVIPLKVSVFFSSIDLRTIKISHNKFRLLIYTEVLQDNSSQEDDIQLCLFWFTQPYSFSMIFNQFQSTGKVYS